MMQFKMRRSKIGSALTITNHLSTPALQSECISQWGKTIPRIIAMGPHAPTPFFGLRYTPTAAAHPLKKLLFSYMSQIPGLEAVILSPSDLKIGGNQQGLLKYVEDMNYDLAWGCNCDTTSGRLFVLSSGLIPHIINDLKDDVTMEGARWSDNLHKWLAHILVHRYFDGTQYQIAESPVLNAYQIPTEPALTPDPALIGIEVATEPEKPVKRKAGRPKKK